ncbi:cytosolic 5'-nucleotidase 1A-like isoform X2 [Conger conger]|uniref:cytosolic 5'-nucleotidase 1A-like isoform X2 n=1 Tax=Conger conger TaxID=82655 RepID=UPI002A5A49CB|nr:cytosolic 5'-nucleotidase 1A-like isoform X2 [Conger conger]
MSNRKAKKCKSDKGVGDGPAGKRLQGPMTIAVSEILLINMEKPGVAFPFIKALVNVNDHFHKLHPDSEFPFHIALMTKNQAQEQHIRNHLNRLGLSQVSIHQDDYSSKPEPKVLYLSEDPDKAEEAIETGHAAAIMFPNDKDNKGDGEGKLRVAFDGDGVLFSDESEIVFKKKGLDAYLKNEDDSEDIPLGEGPLKCFLEALVNMEKKLHAKHPNENFPVQTFLVTSRDPVISGTRVLKTLKSWGLELTQAFFLSGRPKGPPLSMIQPHIFFDDQKPHIDGALKLGIISAHVPYGIGYETYKDDCEK